jgi:predicted amidohydrolase YtcJ
VRPARLAADLVITNARIWTGDALQPDANAVAVVGDRIVEVGSSQEIDRGAGRRRPSSTSKGGGYCRASTMPTST